ncbi:hypothetical protein HDV00_009214 [Rhizophlyctis rosea]|nr:hypothetical protein HDV00_009214 [Rhizophlyctis rosea]
MPYVKAVSETRPTLPQEIIREIALVSGPIRSRNLRNTSKRNQKLITLDDIAWAEAGWRYRNDGLEECWDWAVRNWHCEVIWAYLSDVSARKQMDLFHRAAGRGDVGTVSKLLTEFAFDHSTRDALFMLDGPTPNQVPSMVAKFPRSGPAALLREATDGPLSNVEIHDKVQDVVEAITPTRRALHYTTSADVMKLFLKVRRYIRRDLRLLGSIRFGAADAVKLFLRTGAELEEEDLIEAAAVGVVEVVEILLKAGADVHRIAGNNPLGPLAMAAKHGHIEVVRLLINVRASVDGGFRIGNGTLRPHQPVPSRAPLVQAAQHGHTEVVQLLLDSGAKIDKSYGTMLKEAVIGGHSEVVKLLLTVRAPFLVREYWHHGDALRKAVLKGDIEMVKLFLDAGVNVRTYVRRYDGGTLEAAAEGGHTEIVKLLLAAGVNTLLGDPLHAAASRGHVDIVRMLLKAGANVHWSDEQALWGAMRGNHLEVVKVLLSAGADFNRPKYRFARVKGEGGMKIAEVVEFMEKLGAGAPI